VRTTPKFLRGGGGECSISVLNRNEKGWEENFLSGTRRAKKETCMKYKQTKHREKKKLVKNKGCEGKKISKVGIEMKWKKRNQT